MENEFKLMSIMLYHPENYSIVKKYEMLYTDRNVLRLLEITDLMIKNKIDLNYMTIREYVKLNNFPQTLIDEWHDNYFNTVGNNPKYYIEILLQENIKRKLDIFLKSDAKEIKSTVEIKHKVSEILKEIQTIDEDEIEDGKKECIKLVENIQNNFIEPRIFSGFEHIEDSNEGYELTDYILIGGQEGVGKTTFVMNLILKQLKKKLKIGFFSCEMMKKKIYNLLTCSLAGVNPKLLQNNLLDDHQKALTANAIASLYEMPLFVIEKIRNWQEIKDKAMILKDKYDIDMIYIDYLQYLRLIGVNDQYQRLEIISAESKDLANQLTIPVCEISSLSRTGKNIEPESNHLKGNGDIEYNADIIYLMWIINNCVDNNYSRRSIGIKIAKNRNGELCRDGWLFKADIRRFERQGKLIKNEQ